MRAHVGEEVRSADGAPPSEEVRRADDAAANRFAVIQREINGGTR